MTLPKLLPAADIAAAAALLRDHKDYKLVQRLPRPYSDLPEALPEGGRHIALIDTETSGLNPDEDVIIEVGLMHVTLDADDNVMGHSKPMGWLEDPGGPLSPEIQRVTGLSDDDVKGKQLDAAAITSILSRCALVLAHNAKFDVGFIDRRFPDLKAVPWACSLDEIPWCDLGLSCRRLPHLLIEHGGFYDAHRATADVWALFQLLLQPMTPHSGALPAIPEGRTYLQSLLASSRAGAARLRAHGLPYEAKDWAKKRAYRWDPAMKVWWRDVPMADYLAEKAAFVAAGLPEPTGTMIDAVNRHRL